MKTMIVDYGMGNMLSVLRSFEKCGADVSIIKEPKELRYADSIVLPGVGAFPDAMNSLITYGWKDELDEVVLRDGVPLLGICLGMQLLAEYGYEVSKTKGLGYIKGKVTRLLEIDKEKIPHIGWNEIKIVNNSVLFNGIADNTNFYFVHSFKFEVDQKEDVITTTPYCGGFASSVSHGNIFGTQFHPEKSQKAGFRIIKNFLGV